MTGPADGDAPSPPPREDLRGTLVQLRTRVDAHFDAAVDRSPTAFTCAEGCSACCHARFSVFEIEAVPLREALATMAAEDPERRERIRRAVDDPAAAAHCPFLLDDRCAVYEARPIICRSHGLPVIAADENGAEVSHCALNFRSEAPPAPSVLSLERVNAPLSVLARLWDGRGQRVALTALARGDELGA